MEILEVKDLTKVYNSQTVLDIPELKFKAGQSMGLVGNNGAGKTTLFRLILDLIKANRGSVWSKGEDVSKSEVWKKYTGSFIDEGFLIDYLSPDEYFQFIGRLHGLTRGDLEARLSQYEDFFAGEIRGGSTRGRGTIPRPSGAGRRARSCCGRTRTGDGARRVGTWRAESSNRVGAVIVAGIDDRMISIKRKRKERQQWHVPLRGRLL